MPDLRRSAAVRDADMWRQIVIDGLLKDQGMASFRHYMSATQAESIRVYVSNRAAQEKKRLNATRKSEGVRDATLRQQNYALRAIR